MFQAKINKNRLTKKKKNSANESTPMKNEYDHDHECCTGHHGHTKTEYNNNLPDDPIKM